jgi:transposase
MSIFIVVGKSQPLRLGACYRINPGKPLSRPTQRGGRSPYAPQAMVGLILYGIMQGVTSLRDLERFARVDLGGMWVSGGILPDHSIIGRFIQRHEAYLTEEFFVALTRQVVKVTGSDAAIVSGDGTVIETAASRYRVVKQEALDQLHAKAKEAVAEQPSNEKRLKRLTQLQIAQDTLQDRTAASRTFVDYVRERLSLQLAASGASIETIDSAQHFFDCNTLTLGFARRFASYKRPNLLLHDPERLLRLLTNPQRPVQLIIAGKAHPADQTGRALIQQWIKFIRQPEVRPHVIFLSDYDMHLTAHMVQGVDVWLNTPRRPWEACGTSGMKVLVNGGINLSELDGWWAEAYTPEVGWVLGDGQEHDHDPAWDAAEAEALYDLLENEVIPEFYSRDEQGVPIAWVARMRESMALLTPRFSTNRAVYEYAVQHYLPMASSYLARAADKGAMGVELVNWHQQLEQQWSALHFGELKQETVGDQHVFEVQVYLDDLDPEAVRSELYANGVDGCAAERVEMQRVRQLVGALNGYAYHAEVLATRPATDYTARLIPQHDAVVVPLEEAHILWRR